MIAIATWLALVATPGCVEVKGGAVELSWLLQDFDGEDVKCVAARIEQIRVCWVPLSDGGVEAECATLRAEAGFVELFREFDCVEQRGVTRFELPTGDNAIFVRPVCNGAKPPTGRYQVPAPIVRRVGSGEVVTLNQLLLVVDANCDDGECTCPP